MPNMSATTSTRESSRRQVLRFGLATAVLAPLGAVAACNEPSGKAPKGQVHRLLLAGMAFGPAPAGLAVGDVIEWVNQDIFEHTATARDGQFDVDLKPKTNAQTVLRKAGTIDVYCRFHPGMTLQLKVGG
jgi:plastocyanin